MKDSIANRELFALDGSEYIVCGTHHKAYDDDRNGLSKLSTDERIGVVFLNSTSPTRAANGDAAVYLADALAECGYPSFRLDLPGFGDSEENPPEDLLGFISKGGYAPIASANVRELVTRFSLSGVIIVGHCAGSVSALYTAAISRECKGLVLIGPFFHLTQPISPPRIRRQLKLWALHSRPGARLSNIVESLSNIRFSLRSRGLPRNANQPLIRCWKQLASKGLPILILTGIDRRASTAKPIAGEFNYLQYLLRVAGRESHVAVKVTDGADNAFANRKGRTAVQQHAERWLKDFFPLKKHEENIVHTLDSERDESGGHNKLHHSYLHE